MCPLYTYSCIVCNYEIEKLESISAEVSQTCPACLTRKGLRRTISVSNFALKGSGWYKDNYSIKR